MFENSNHGHWELFVPKTRWGSPFKEAIYFCGGSSNPKSIFKASHLYMVVLVKEVIFAYPYSQ